MPILRKRSSKKTNTKTKSNLIGDITINDFANSPTIHARLKKATISVASVNYEVEEKMSMDEEVWNKTDNYDPHSSNTDNCKKNVKGNQVRHKKTLETSVYTEDREEGIDYPLDLWFIISEYISPEVVGKFARICKSSYHVTTTAKFWFHLYKTYCRAKSGGSQRLPERLQPQCMYRLHGLRACVIRTLHYTYFDLKRNIDSLSQDELVKRRCCAMWTKKGTVVWYFYFILKEVPKSSRNSLKEKFNRNSKKTDFLKMLEDVAVNPEEGCKLLRVACVMYCMLPHVVGLILQKVTRTLKQDFTFGRLQLGFGTSDVPNTLTNQVVLNNVVECQVLDWWHPSFPYQDTITTIELPHNDSWDQIVL